MNDKFNCYIIGNGSHLIQCAEILLEKGHEIYGIISSKKTIMDWAEKKGVPYIDLNSDIGNLLARQPFDYLFSIINTLIIPDELLALPRKGAINFHDGPLPRYAGLYVTSWALINGEKSHGVTWHLMTAGTDKGDILKQSRIDVINSDTAFTLNTKCYEASIVSFDELVNELAQGHVEFRRQNLDERTCFSKYKRPVAACTISWNKPADQIAAFIRALDFGPNTTYSNPIGLPKILIGKNVYIVPEIEVLNTISGTQPGTITSIENDFLKVSTFSTDIAVRKLITMNGQLLTVSDFVSRAGVGEGYTFDELGDEIIHKLTALNSEICRYEEFWLNAIMTLQPAELPYYHYTKDLSQGAQYASVPAPIFDKFNDYLTRRYESSNRSDLMLASFATYLARVSSNYTFDLGYSYSSLQKTVNGFVPFFATHVPLRVELDPSEGFYAALDKLQAQLAIVREHKTYARDIILRYPELHLIKVHGTQLPLSIIVDQVESLGNYTPMPGSELTLLLSEDGSKWRWVYDTNVLDKESISSMQLHFTTFLNNVISDEKIPLTDVSLLTETEHHQLLIEWNNTKSDYPRHLCLNQLFEAQEERTPDAVAVVYQDQQLTYNQLNGRANQLARYLNKFKIGPDTLVGIYMDRSIEMIVGLLGILKAGGAYLPLDHTYPRERISLMLEDAQVPVILTQERLVKDLPAHQAQVVQIDTDWKTISTESEENVQSGVNPENLSYVIYTSGSTGKPKGVMINHSNIVNLFFGMDACIGNDPGTWLAVTSISFDISVLEIFWTLARGFKVVISDVFNGHQEKEGGIASVSQLMKHHDVTHFQCTPSMASMLMVDREAKSSIQRLKKFLIGGEAFPANLVAQLQKVVTGDIINMYGPTETTVWSTTYTLNGDKQSVPIGRPIANTEIYIVDRNLQPVPIGIPGELLIGGAGVARGYLKNPDLTSERFIKNPFCGNSGGCLYRTGDLARYLPNRNIDYIGRMDHQVKIRGHRVELGEIETVLNDYSFVYESVVIARTDVPGQKKLVAYVIPISGDDFRTEDLISYAKEKLPGYMVPAYVVPLKEFPQTPNKKIDRKALPIPKEVPNKAGCFAPPQTDIEEAIAEIWAEALGVQRVGRNENFFDMGGDSLTACGVILNIQRTCNVDLPLQTIFHAPMVATFAENLEEVFLNQARSENTIMASSSSRDEDHFGSSFTQTEKVLADLWKKTLRISCVNRNDHFFRLGGKSLDAVRLFVEIERLYGKKFPLSTLFQAPSLKQLANLIDGNTYKSSWSPLVPVQPNGSRPSFFCIHGHRGNVLNYFALARHLGPEQPFYGLQARGLDGENIVFRSFSEMASDYINEIRTIQPKGPYRIGGWCMGGSIALEMAHLLKEEGEEVALLALIDTAHPSYPEYLPRTTVFHRLLFTLLERIDYEFSVMRGLSKRELGGHIRGKANALILPIKVLAEKIIDLSFSKLNLKTPFFQAYRLNRLYDMHTKANSAYNPRPYHGRSVVIRARKQPLGIHPDPSLGWGNLLSGKVDSLEIPGHYVSLLVEPNVRLLADALKECLNRIEN